MGSASAVNFSNGARGGAAAEIKFMCALCQQNLESRDNIFSDIHLKLGVLAKFVAVRLFCHRNMRHAEKRHGFIRLTLGP